MDVGEVEVGERETIEVGGEAVELTPVSVGNPHAVIRREPDRDDLLRLGPLVENHERFPERTNVQLMRVDGPNDISVGVWERGAGETLSSGTSSVAAAAAAVANGWCESPVTVHLAGGDLARRAAGRPRAPDRPRAGDLPRRAGGGVRAVRFSKRLDQVPPYLFAELERKISADGIRGDRRDQPRHRRPRPAHARAGDRGRGAGHARPCARTITRRITGRTRSARPSPSFYRDRFGVDLALDGEIVPVLGGKEGVSHVALIALDPGDLCLAPDPGYPPYTSGPLFAGSEPYYLPLRGERLPARPRLDPGRRPRARQPALPQLPEQPDRRDRARGLLRTRGRVRPRATTYRRPRQRVLGDLLRGLPRAELPRDARREGRRRRDLLALQGLEHDGLALRPDGGQRRDRRALPAAEDEHRLGHVRGDAGRRRGRADGGARLPARRCRPSTSAGAISSRTRCARSASTSRRRSRRRTSGRASPTGTRRDASPSSSSSGRRCVVSPGSAYGPSGEGFVRISLTVPDDRLEEAVSRIESALTGVELQSS